MYKCYKKVNNEWVLDEQATTTLERKANEIPGSWSRYNEIITTADELGYVRVMRNNSDYFYYKDHCGKIELHNGQVYYVKDNTTEEINALTNDELKSKYNVVRCEHCNKFVNCSSYEIIKVGRNHFYCSENCAKHHATKCNHCGKWYMKANSFTTDRIEGLTSNENYKLCNHCYNHLKQIHKVETCEDCGKIVYNPTRVYNNGGYHYYCSHCAENYVTPRVIRSYHEQHREGWQKQHATYEKVEKNTYHCGVELECELKNTELQANDVAYQIHKLVNANGKLFEFEYDGSLNNGYETISQPCTMAWWHENTPLVKQMLEKMTSLGCISHNSNNCGLHIHIGRNFFNDYEYETRFVALFYHLKDELIKFSRRAINRMGYCSFQRNFDKRQVFLCKKGMERTRHGSKSC